jgi:hypothetical protein
MTEKLRKTSKICSIKFSVQGPLAAWFSLNDAFRFTGIRRSTLYLLIASGEIEIIKLGASTLVVTESLRRFINEKRRRAS